MNLAFRSLIQAGQEFKARLSYAARLSYKRNKIKGKKSWVVVAH